MSFGGHVAGMINSLKNNNRLLTSVKERRKYAMEHHAEKKVMEQLKDKPHDPQLVQQLKEEAMREYRADLRIQKVVILGILLFAIITFSFLFSFLQVV